MFTLVMFNKHFQRGGYGKWGANLSPTGSPGTSFFLFFFFEFDMKFYMYFDIVQKNRMIKNHFSHSMKHGSYLENSKLKQKSSQISVFEQNRKKIQNKKCITSVDIQSIHFLGLIRALLRIRQKSMKTDWKSIKLNQT